MKTVRAASRNLRLRGAAACPRSPWLCSRFLPTRPWKGVNPREDGIRDLMQQTGMERDELLATLSEHLPRVIDHLTPEGRLPTEQEVSRLA